MKSVVVLLLGTTLSVTAGFAQGTLADYKRAEDIKTSTQNKVYYQPADVQWSDSNQFFWYKVQTPKGEVYYQVDVEKNVKTMLFETNELINKLGSEMGNGRPAQLANVTVLSGGNWVEFEAGGKRWKYDLQKREFDTRGGQGPQEEAPRGYWGRRSDERTGDPVPSPDGKWVAYIKNHNVYIKSGEEEVPLSYDGSPGEYYSAAIFWSPDSKNLAVNKIRPGGERTLYLIESSPVDQLQPKLHTRQYLKPGDALPQKQPTLFNVATRKMVQVDKQLIVDQYSVSNPIWFQDGRAFTFEYNKRGHQQYNIFSVDVITGKSTAVVKEVSKTFINYSGKRFRYDVSDGEEIIWMSERDGWNHLYLYDGATGQVKNQITSGDWVVRDVVHVDEANRKILLAGSGRDQDKDPYFLHYYTIDFDGGNFKELTTEDGNHVAVFSPDYKYFVDTWSRIDQPAVSVLRNTNDGRVVMDLEEADITDLLVTGWQMPEVFIAKGRDGKTDIWGMIIRPSNFDPTKKYPVIEYIYAGPQGSFVPKNFVADSRGDLHQLVELGFIVVQMDGMGTSNRSKAFHDVCFQNLKDAGFPDRIAWMKAAASKYPYMDLERVGIFGNSAGGQNSAGALLHHPEFYKVAVSSSGCHDNRMDKMWWNEQWMGYPIGQYYAESSNVTHAHKLEGKLLLILGELDDNVDPSSTYQLVNAIIKSNKYVDLLVIPGMGHSLGGDYGEHRRRDFFVKHLIGVDPPEWKELIAED